MKGYKSVCGVYAFVRANGETRIGKIMEGLGLTRSTTRNYLQALIVQGLVSVVGNGNETRYRVVPFALMSESVREKAKVALGIGDEFIKQEIKRAKKKHNALVSLQSIELTRDENDR